MNPNTRILIFIFIFLFFAITVKATFYKFFQCLQSSLFNCKKSLYGRDDLPEMDEGIDDMRAG